MSHGHVVIAAVRHQARLPADLSDRCRTVVADLRHPLPADALREEIQSVEPSEGLVLVHAAEVRYPAPEVELFAANRDGTSHAVGAALALGARRLVVISSIEASGPVEFGPGDLGEYTVPSPVKAYGRSKLAGEVEARRLAKEARDLDGIATRPGR
jgi:nucleoside-diphosphate-sugar epimerase